MCYPKRTDKPLFHNLVAQCEAHDIAFLEPDALPLEPGKLAERADVVLDALFGFSFKVLMFTEGCQSNVPCKYGLQDCWLEGIGSSCRGCATAVHKPLLQGFRASDVAKSKHRGPRERRWTSSWTSSSLLQSRRQSSAWTSPLVQLLLMCVPDIALQLTTLVTHVVMPGTSLVCMLIFPDSLSCGPAQAGMWRKGMQMAVASSQTCLSASQRPNSPQKASQAPITWAAALCPLASGWVVASITPLSYCTRPANVVFADVGAH